ncbi:MAG TPA: sugar ABC transporter permease [Anaerolineae bacterium]|nr:sugar ABC transporter permease [Anaerolineae bacterium]
MRITLRRRHALTGYGFIALWLAGFLLFLMVPLVQNLIWSFTDRSMQNVSDPLNFIGMENYVEAFTIDIEFVPYLLETFRNLVIDVPVILAFALAVALLAMQDVPGGMLFRAIFFLPVVVGSAAVIGRLFDMSGGQLVLFRGQGAQQFLQIYLGDRLPAFMQFLNRSIFVLWRTGVQILIFVAGLKSIDPALYEAAEVDGASAWARFWKVTLPMLSPVMLVNIVYTIIDSFTDYFNRVLWYIRMVTFRTDLRLGYPSALGFIYFILVFILVILVFGFVSRLTFYRGER